MDELEFKYPKPWLGPLLLAELLLHLKRYDILRRVFGASRGEMENTLGSRQLLPRFRSALFI